MLNYLNLLVVRDNNERMQLCHHIMRMYIYILLCDSLTDDYTDKYRDQEGRSSWSNLESVALSVLKERGIMKSLMGTEVVFFIALLFLHFIR